jgi:hypothetical protein
MTPRGGARRFVPVDRLDTEGYGDYKQLFETEGATR